LSEQIVIVETLVDDLWLAIADSSQIENAVLNLAINSRDAMPDGGTLTIDCRNATVDETYAPAYGTEFQRATTSSSPSPTPATVWPRMS